MRFDWFEACRLSIWLVEAYRPCDLIGLKLVGHRAGELIGWDLSTSGLIG